MQKTFVLVHGAWYGGWCYARVAKLLRDAGHLVFTPTLTGVGERSHLLSGSVNLTTHITDILNVFKWEGLDNVVLVGHSYGGMVVTGVADRIPQKITSLIYLDAFLPRNNQCLHDLVPPQDAQAQRESATELNNFGVAPISAAVFQVNEADREWVDSLCTPHPLHTLTEPLRLTGGLDKITRRTYVLASSGPPFFRAFRDSVAADPRWRTEELPCGHDVMIDLPVETARILMAD